MQPNMSVFICAGRGNYAGPESPLFINCGYTLNCYEKII